MSVGNSKKKLKKANLDQIFNALLKVPPLKWEKSRERNEVVKSGKEIDIKPLLKELKIKEINEWVKETISEVDNLIFELFPNAIRKIPHLNTHIRYEWGESSLLCISVRQSKLWIYSGENEVSKLWQKSQDSNLIKEGFAWKLEIAGEKNYWDNLPSIKECLELNKKRNLKS